MRLKAEQIDSFLKNQQGKIIPAFLLAGDEPLQLMETADAIRQFSQQQGYSERDILYADAQFDWGALLDKLLDLRIMTKSLGQAGSKAIRDYMQNPPNDKMLLVQCPKLVGNARNSAWVKAIDKTGVVIQIWDKSTPETMAWVAQRLRQKGMRPTADAVRVLTERVEGNLLAATQEINKLALLFHKEH